jgi:hypothetical protein
MSFIDFVVGCMTMNSKKGTNTPRETTACGGRGYLGTGLAHCYGPHGEEVACAGSGQDAECTPGTPWPAPRFVAAEGEGGEAGLVREGLVRDELTGLAWTRDANPAQFPLTWTEALDHVEAMNRARHAGREDWRMPTRRELRSLISYQERLPALPAGHPFVNVFSGWRWTSTTAAVDPALAWYVHSEGGRMFYGRKDAYCLLWPVCGASAVLPETGQRAVWDARGRDVQTGWAAPWPEPRFESATGISGPGGVDGTGGPEGPEGPEGKDGADAVRDRLTGLLWARTADAFGPLSWTAALERARAVGNGWRLPTINELESLVDAARHSPALPEGHPFAATREAYWSSTSSGFAPDWAMVLYLHKGAVGVGFKTGEPFAAWLVRDPVS